MNKIGINISIDVTKLDKARFIEGKNGKYVDLTAFVDLSKKDQYGNNGPVSQSVSKEERQQGVQMPFIGNVRVFYSDAQPQQSGQYVNQDGSAMSPQQVKANQQAPMQPAQDGFDDDLNIPF